MSEWSAPTARERLAVLQSTRTIAIVGASAKPDRASYFVATYLLAKTPYTVWFVNPSAKEILGHRVHPSLDALPGVPDLVDVFRRVEELPQVTEEAIRIGAPALWFQLGLVDQGSAQRAHDAGLTVVMDRCVKIEHARFAGGLHLAGFDTGVLSSRRSPDLGPA